MREGEHVMPTTQPSGRIRCYTRAWKNARYLREQDPATFSKDKNAEGFGTGVPIDVLQVLHRLKHDSPELRAYGDVSDFLKTHTVPGPQRWQL
jgi:hypothetical protein